MITPSATMENGKAKFGITFALFLSLLLYHFLQAVGQLGETSQWLAPIPKLYNLASILMTTLFFVWAIDAKLLIRSVLRNDYVGGHYRGTSEDFAAQIKENSQSGRQKHFEIFEIQQTLISTIISGRSYLSEDRDRLIASYSGKQFKKDRGRIVFAIELTTDVIEYGILEFNLEDGNADGKYWSTIPDARVPAIFKAMILKPNLPPIRKFFNGISAKH